MKATFKENKMDRNVYTIFSTILLLHIFMWATFSVEIFAQVDFTIDQVMSSGFPTSLTTSSSGDFAAWVQNKKGIRNIYISDGSMPTRKVTSFTNDDGQTISSLIFSPDNKYLFFVRGGAPNRYGEIANPLSSPEKAKREIWKINLEKDSLKLVSEGSSPSLSHNGTILAFINKGQAWKAELSSEKNPELFFSIRGSVGSLTWAPDDTKLAFISNRSDHSFIGVYHLVTKSIIYIAPSVDYDSNPVWAADSKRIAYIRVPRESQTLPFIPRRSALPWSIHIGNSDNGTSTEIWKATEGAGSAFRFISASNQLFWIENDHLVFPWDGDGWTHLYSIKSDGSMIKLLTPGESEVHFVSISNDKKSIL